MQKAKQNRYLVPVVLLALLLVGMTLNSVTHHHAGSSESNCTICHLSHQPMDQPLVENHGPALVLLAPTAEPPRTELVPSLVFSRLPARAPPAG